MRKQAMGAFIVAVSLLASTAGAASYDRPQGHRQIDIPQGPGSPQGTAFGSSMSFDGTVVAFDTDAGLRSQDINQKTDVYVRDLRTDSLALGSLTVSGGNAAGSATLSCVTALGLRNSFVRGSYYGAEGPWSYDLAPGDQVGAGHDLALSWDPAISGNGRYVAFVSHATNLWPGDTDLAPDVFLFDRRSNELMLVSEEGGRSILDGGNACPASWSPSIDHQGKKVSFTSLARLAPEDHNDRADVYVYDRSRERLTLASKPRGEGCEASESPIPSVPPLPAPPVPCGVGATHSSLSGNGRFVTFQSDASDLVTNDTNGGTDVFVADLRKKSIERVSLDSQGGQLGDSGRDGNTNPYSGIALTPFAQASNPQLPQHSISRDGRYVVFYSNVWDAVPNPDPLATDLVITGYYVRDRKTGRTTRVNVTAWGAAGPGSNIEGGAPGISGDGRYVQYPKIYNRHNCNGTVRCSSGESEPIVFDTQTGAMDSLFAPIITNPLPCEQSPALPPYPLEAMSGWFGDISGDGRYMSFAICRPGLQDRPDSKIYRNHIVLFDRGTELGVGGFGDSPPAPKEPPDDRICVIPDLCIPPGAAVASSDGVNDLDQTLTEQGANLYGASLAYRPQYQDLFAAIELEHMPPVLPGLSPLFYGLRFEVEDKSYEVRATSFNFGTFGLFDCTETRPLCTKVADLRGGYGTTGMRVVFSLPLAEIGLEKGGELKDVEAFSGLGSYMTGAAKVLDRVRLK